MAAGNLNTSELKTNTSTRINFSNSAKFQHFTALTICRTIEGADLIHPIDCLFFADNVIVVTDCPSVEAVIGEVKVMVTEDTATIKAFSFDSASGIKFPFGLCEVDGEV